MLVSVETRGERERGGKSKRNRIKCALMVGGREEVKHKYARPDNIR